MLLFSFFLIILFTVSTRIPVLYNLKSQMLLLSAFCFFYSLWLIIERLKIGRWIAETFVSISFTIILFFLWPSAPIFDDSAIILKYMDNFARGYFYCYNIQDGPVYGISSFIHGILAGGFAYAHLFTPLNSLFASNFIGLFLVGFLSFRLLSYYIHDSKFIFPAWVLLMLSSEFFIMNAKQGLETPLHLALVIASFLFFLLDKPKIMWTIFVLAVISKLDALPVILVLSLIYIVKNKLYLTPLTIHNKAISSFLIYAVAPGTVWLIGSSVLFGSPIPQTAYAKLFYHRSRSEYWFPFMESLFSSKNSIVLIAVIVGVVIFSGYVILSIRRRSYDKIYTHFIYGFSVVACLILYYFYNPEERMGWYYVVPSFLISLQSTVIVYDVGKKILDKYSILIGVICFSGFAFIYWPRIENTIIRVESGLALVENERMAIGDWIKENSNPTDTLLTGFGYIARNSGLYTVDYTGLNSKITTDFNLDLNALIQHVNPRWIVLDTLLSSAAGIDKGYSLRKSYFNLAMMGKQSWRVFERASPVIPRSEFVIDSRMLLGAGEVIRQKGGLKFKGDSLTFAGFPGDMHVSRFVAGLIRKESDVEVVASIIGTNGSEIFKNTLLLEKQEVDSYVEGYTMEWSIALDPALKISRIMISAFKRGSNRAVMVELLDPILIAGFNL